MIMKRIEKLAAILAAVAVPAMAGAQDKVEASVGADLVSSYIWRGQKLGDAAIQPSASIAYQGLSLTAWGSYPVVTSTDSKEIDLTLAYSTGGFNIGITDYFAAGDDARYFMYEAHKTAHVFEANIGYDFGPFSFQWFTNFSGADGINKSGDRAYTSYFELAAPFKLGGLDWTATVGAVPYASDFYACSASGFAVTNLTVKATKDIKVTNSFSIPMFAAITANPSSEKAYFTVGMTF